MERLGITTLIGFAVALVVIAGLVSLLFSTGQRGQVLSITSFEECAAAGYPIMESYLEQCATPDGLTFVRDISNDVFEEANNTTATDNSCAPAGCSGQLCVDEGEVPDIITTCEFRPEYTCYQQYGRCERQVSGQCGWTETPEIEQCLTEVKVSPAAPRSSDSGTVEVVF
ncbi:hypothetical protein A3H15_01455 [Candidatus Kaiserbacteria bacterium RIFCSPLOWO2_12_FULL_50_28]|uniref:Uncharacterized protein n=1 Tax=Candidatus Kaiserbacteria bacterium RIFCSPLOWO2_12_FULL_50_28 TaxID=1798527 RepID=A0A1F6FMG1_9BACT|nr:MAG: hypothetical protein A3H15_01455 [Candidatus Kaiserbacteria bacterium RIFCSPLOWO2_12_FULL_50_28]